MGKRAIAGSHISPEGCFNEGNTEAELSPYPIWIYRFNSVSQPPEIKINHRDGETIPTLIRGHRSINHSLSPLWPQLSHCSLCSPHYSRCTRGYKPDKSVFTHLEYTIIPAKRCRFTSLYSHRFSHC